MEPIKTISGKVTVLDRADVDTDQIMPKQFLKRIERTGFGEFAFFDWRYRPNGTPNPGFVLNQPRYQGASVLLARKNFGCGSSREHAPWAIQQYGFRALIAPSYADIFFNNCFKNGLLPVVLTEAQIDHLFDEVKAFPGYRLVVDLEQQRILSKDGKISYPFQVDAFRKYCLMNGLDDIGLTLRHADTIRAFEERHLASQPWLANSI